MRSHFWLKSIGSTVVISAFFVAYFHVLNHPVFPVRVMLLVAVDGWVPVVSSSVWVYFSLWVYICLPSALMRTRGMLGIYLLGAFVMSAAALAVFIFFPTAVPPCDIDWSAYPALAFLKESDASGNACPSLHVGFAFYSALWMATLLKHLSAGPAWQWTSCVWSLLIILSTMTTKQHVFLDVVFGIPLGAAAYRLSAEIRMRKGIPL